MDPPLRPDLDLGMDELAHRLTVARAQGGQEAASELLTRQNGALPTPSGLLHRSTLPSTSHSPAAQVLDEAPRLVAEACIAPEAERDTDQTEQQQDPRPGPEPERVWRGRVEIEAGDHQEQQQPDRPHV